MTERNAVIGWPPARDYSSLKSWGVFGASEADPNYPASQLGTFPFSYVWRSAQHPIGAIPTIELSVTFNVEVEANCLVLVHHNLSSLATWSWSIYADDAMTELVWSSPHQLVWPPTKTDVEWRDPNFWSRTLPDNKRAGRTWSHAQYVPGLIYAKAAKLSINDRSNPAGLLQAGGLEVAGLRRFLVNPNIGAQTGKASDSPMNRIESGRLDVRTKPSWGVFRGSISYAPKDWVLGPIMDWMEEADRGVPAWFCLDPSDLVNALRLGFMAQHRESPLATWSTADLQGIPIDLAEAIG